MRTEKPIEISVKAVFIGIRSAEQAFIELIRRKSAAKPEDGLEPLAEKDYNNSVVFPGVHAPKGV